MKMMTRWQQVIVQRAFAGQPLDAEFFRALRAHYTFDQDTLVRFMEALNAEVTKMAIPDAEVIDAPADAADLSSPA